LTFDPIEGLGLLAGFFGTFAATPQAIKIIRTRSAGDVSLAMFSMALVGAILWGAYGVLKGLPSVVLWNVIAAVQMALIIALKLRHDRAPDGPSPQI